MCNSERFVGLDSLQEFVLMPNEVKETLLSCSEGCYILSWGNVSFKFEVLAFLCWSASRHTNGKSYSIIACKLTCPEPRHSCRGEPVSRITSPQLPVIVFAPAHNEAVGKKGTRVQASRGESYYSCKN